ALGNKCFSQVIKTSDGNFAPGEIIKTQGDLILILDCDHIPTRNMPAAVVGHFSDPKVFLVQTPHFMLNADPVRKNLNDEKNLPCESWLFYRNVQRGMDSWNGAFFCGSAAFMRRTMLEEIGGIMGETITEDCETSLALHAKGYRSVYVDTPMVAGLAPESFSDMIKQRRRWCQGMLQILLLKMPLLQKGLSIPQRFCYMNNCLFWLFPIPRITFLVAPLMFLLFNIHIYNASVEQVIFFAGPHLFAAIFLSMRLHGKLRPFLYSEVLEALQSFFLVPAIASVLLAPKKPTFLITRKGVTLENDSLSPLALPFIILFVLIILGFIFGFYTMQANPLMRETVYITFFWNAYNMCIALCCLGAVWERRQRRKSHRLCLSEAASLDSMPGTLENLSYGGFSIQIDEKIENPSFA
ncbi:MAG: glycosyltransferase family 2 protein, partial [Candidatus Adiutrix sp.]